MSDLVLINRENNFTKNHFTKNHFTKNHFAKNHFGKNSFVRKVKRIILDCRGSASVEFSMLAIPLFIPLFIFIAQFSQSSDTQESLRTLARESVRAFVSSSSDEIAYYVADQIIREGGAILGHKNIEVEIICSSSPCISPDTRVQIRLISKNSAQLKTEVSAIEYVSPWA